MLCNTGQPKTSRLSALCRQISCTAQKSNQFYKHNVRKFQIAQTPFLLSSFFFLLIVSPFLLHNLSQRLQQESPQAKIPKFITDAGVMPASW